MNKIPLPGVMTSRFAWLQRKKIFPWLKKGQGIHGGNTQQASRELLESEEHYRKILDSNTSIAYLIDTDTACIVHANAAAAAFWGYPPKQLRGMSITDINTAPRTDLFKDMYRAQDGIPPRLEWRHRLNSGEIRDVEVYRRPLIYQGRTLLYCIVHDISEKKRAEAELRLAAIVFDTMNEAVMVTNADQHIIKVNRAFSTITGYAPDEVLGRHQDLLSSGIHSPAFHQKMKETLAMSGVWQGEVRKRRKNGEIYVEWLSLKRVHDEEGALTHHVAVFSDISARKATEEHMRYLAHYDPLTDLPTRSLFIDRLRQALIQARRNRTHMAILFLNLDQFKLINNIHSHDVGDLLLRGTAERVLHCLRKADTAARTGGDEFVVLLPNIQDSEDALKIAEKILHDIRQPFEVCGKNLLISGSIGVAVYPDHGNEEKLLLINADIALYHAKQNRRNNVKLYQPAMLANGKAA